MFRLSEIVSKPVISLYEARREGIVVGCIFDAKMSRLMALAVECEDETDAGKKRLDLKNIYKHDSDAVVVKNSAVLRFCDKAIGGCPIGLIAYDHEGTVLGTIDDIGIDVRGKVLWISCNGVNLECTRLVSRSDKLVIFCGAGKPPKLTSPRSKRVATKRIEAALAKAETAGGQIRLHAQVSRTPPPKDSKMRNYDFLVSKIVERDIVSSIGEVIALEGDVITDAIIDLARNDHKLVQLALYCR